mmetsp:Transcript_15470/g.25164  ORF Transcript_15470/g.25164 Transcript_15470/m.25164 type:complete len:274 (+) Transcript_15470:2-823(+)
MNAYNGNAYAGGYGSYPPVEPTYHDHWYGWPAPPTNAPPAPPSYDFMPPRSWQQISPRRQLVLEEGERSGFPHHPPGSDYRNGCQSSKCCSGHPDFRRFDSPRQQWKVRVEPSMSKEFVSSPRVDKVGRIEETSSPFYIPPLSSPSSLPPVDPTPVSVSRDEDEEQGFPLTTSKSLNDDRRKKPNGRLRVRTRPVFKKETVRILRKWMFSPKNISFPYPSEKEEIELSELTKISIKQLRTWFQNNRKRLWKPYMEKHHPHVIESLNQGPVEMR